MSYGEGLTTHTSPYKAKGIREDTVAEVVKEALETKRKQDVGCEET